MKFRTEVDIQESVEKIGINDQVFSIGSCFATEISSLLQNGQICTYNNPFGTLFNPFSIHNAIRKIHENQTYTEADLVKYKDRILSLDHHSSFSSDFVHTTLEKINSKIEQANHFLQNTKWVFITIGTSFIYEFLPKNKLVANCHKIPAKFFSKRLLSYQEIQYAIKESIELLNDICSKDVQIIFTVSPVRHTKDGMIENTRSKSLLINGIHDTIEGISNCTYLPIYEMMIDDLRDYRFYREDMIHPSQQAIQYIFEKFGKAYFTNETMDFVEENLKIATSLAHKPFDQNTKSYKEFKEKLIEKIQIQQTKVKRKIFENINQLF